jgi:hypothetical protein
VKLRKSANKILEILYAAFQDIDISRLVECQLKMRNAVMEMVSLLQ